MNYTPPCIDGPEHAVTKGHCWKCGLIVKPPRKKRKSKPKSKRLLRRDSLPATMQRLIERYGPEKVEDALYEAWPVEEPDADRNV